MTEKEYLVKLSAVRESRKNDIISAVNRKVPKKEAGLKTEVERVFYDRLWREATAHEKKYGKWPVFEMCEVETNDPRLDIYSGPPERDHVDHIEEV